MHRVDDVKEIFHHSNPLQRDALGLRQTICPLRQGGQAVLVSGMAAGETDGRGGNGDGMDGTGTAALTSLLQGLQYSSNPESGGLG